MVPHKKLSTPASAPEFVTHSITCGFFFLQRGRDKHAHALLWHLSPSFSALKRGAVEMFCPTKSDSCTVACHLLSKYDQFVHTLYMGFWDISQRLTKTKSVVFFMSFFVIKKVLLSVCGHFSNYFLHIMWTHLS